MKSLMQLAALGGGLLLMATTPLQASIQVFTAAGVSCQQLFAGERSWTPSGSIHIGWSHPSIHGKVTLADVVEDDPAHQHWSFSMDTHLSIDYFGEHHFDSVMQGATRMTDATASINFLSSSLIVDATASINTLSASLGDATASLKAAAAERLVRSLPPSAP